MNQILYSGKKKNNIELNINSKTIAIICLIIFAILIFCLSTVFAFANQNNTCILSTITVNSTNLSELSKEDAILKLKSDLIETEIPDSIKITVNDSEYSIDTSNLNISYDYIATIENAYNIGRNSNFISNNYTILKASLFGVNITPVCIIDETSFNNVLGQLESELNIENLATNQSYKIEDKTLYVTKGTSGYGIDENNLKEQLISSYIKNNFNLITGNIVEKTAKDINIDDLYSLIHTEPSDAKKIIDNDITIFEKAIDGISFDKENAKTLIANSTSNTIEIPLIITSPSITNEMVMTDMFNDILATFTTEFDKTNENRVENIRLATEKINGTILLPEDEFSFNNTVGPRTEINGYKTANCYINGTIKEDIGGGVCQVSSTLYNAALLTNMQITERKNHTYAVSYVPAGQDATVSYGITDLKFKNNRVTPVKINAEISENILKVNILGTKSIEDYDVKLENITTGTVPFTTKQTEVDTLAKGKQETTQNGIDGQTIETYKILYKNGVEQNKQLITTSTYMPLEQLVNVGTKVSNNTTSSTKKNTSSNSKKNNNKPVVKPTTPSTPPPTTTYTPPTLPPGWNVPENPYYNR